MSDLRIKRALLSVYDKTGIVDFAKALHHDFGIEIISTGGTAALLRENDIPVTLVEEVTGFPEMMDGRVKTLHPHIHAAILADRDNPEHMRQLAEQSIEPIDMVVVNLYPFEKTIADPKCSSEDAIEMIDIGGPCLLRAAAKNHKHVLIVPGPEHYAIVLGDLKNHGKDRSGGESAAVRAGMVFAQTAQYDGAITKWLTAAPPHNDPLIRFIKLRSWGRLRYGENPHQQAELHELIYDEWAGGSSTPSLLRANLLQGEMSFNNYLDANAALELCAELSQGPADSELGISRCVCVFVKHGNACGVGWGTDPLEAYRLAYLGDPRAAMGGVLAVNLEVDARFATEAMHSLSNWGKAVGAGAFFIEVWMAPSFSDEAVGVIHRTKKWGKRVRLVPVKDLATAPDSGATDFRRISGGFLCQSRDTIGLEDEENWKVVTKRRPSDAEMENLRLAWLVCKHTKSNAISICADGMLIGNGAGQMSRVMSCRIATWLAQENGHEEKLRGAVAASDAFFPFRDGPDLLIDAGVSAIIQPGGSKRDAETIAACDEQGVAMVLTGTRHFRH